MSAPDYFPSLPLAGNPVLLFGLLLLAGFAGGELAHRLARLPRITGYILVGMVLGMAGLGVIDRNGWLELRIFVDIALGLILFELGRRLDFNWLRRDLWFAATAVAESALSFACIYLVLIYLDVQPLYAAVAAAIGVSTSPAVVMLVAQELRAEGQVTERALNLVAINSVAAYLLATVLLSWLHHEYRAGWPTAVSHPLYLLAGSVLLGYVMSWVAIVCARWVGKREELQTVLLFALILLCVGGALALKFSVMLALLAFGVMVKNVDEKYDLMAVDSGRVGQMFFVVLFVATGATLQVPEFATGWAVGIAYILARFAGKSAAVLGLAYFSGVRRGSPGLLALTLTPMSGLAIVMVYGTTELYPDFTARLAEIMLPAVLILELVGPLAVQFALRKAGEAGEEAA
jgi:Kef-type K+ transport system membrane component KefB